MGMQLLKAVAVTLEALVGRVTFQIHFQTYLMTSLAILWVAIEEVVDREQVEVLTFAIICASPWKRRTKAYKKQLVSLLLYLVSHAVGLVQHPVVNQVNAVHALEWVRYVHNRGFSLLKEPVQLALVLDR